MIEIVPNIFVAPGAIINGGTLRGALLDSRLRVRPGVWYAHPETAAIVREELESLVGYVDTWAECALRDREHDRWADDGGAR